MGVYLGVSKLGENNSDKTLDVQRKKQKVEIRQGCHFGYDKQILKQGKNLVVEKCVR